MIREGSKIFFGIVVAFSILFFASRLSQGNQISLLHANRAQVIATEEQIVKTYTVKRVVDGDTIVLEKNGNTDTVRLIGVNTPETVDPRKPVQCFGREASSFVKSMLLGKSVHLESDVSQDDRDKYGRLLRYVYLDDMLINEEIISSGFGYEYTYDVPYQFQKEFKASEAYAREGRIGLWSSDTCNGELKPAL